MKSDYLALYSHKYKAEKSVNYFCINLKPWRVSRVFVPFTNKELCSGESTGCASGERIGPAEHETGGVFVEIPRVSGL